MTLQPLQFLNNGLTCRLFDHKTIIATDGTTLRDITTLQPLGSTDVYILPRFSSPIDLTDCVHNLMYGTDIKDVSQSCPVHCIETDRITIEMLNETTFYACNPKSTLHVICDTILYQTLKPITQGRYELSMPCNCALQESVGTDILVDSRPICEQGHQVVVNKDWIGEKFSSLNLFVPSSDIANLNIDDSTMPPLKLVTVPPIDGHVQWTDLPFSGMGRVQSTLWTMLFSLIGLSGLLFLLNRAGLVAPILKCVRCMFSCCCKRAVNVSETLKGNESASSANIQDLPLGAQNNHIPMTTYVSRSYPSS